MTDLLAKKIEAWRDKAARSERHGSHTAAAHVSDCADDMEAFLRTHVLLPREEVMALVKAAHEIEKCLLIEEHAPELILRLIQVLSSAPSIKALIEGEESGAVGHPDYCVHLGGGCPKCRAESPCPTCGGKGRVPGMHHLPGDPLFACPGCADLGEGKRP